MDEKDSMTPDTIPQSTPVDGTVPAGRKNRRPVVIGVAGAGQEISTRPFQLVTGRRWLRLPLGLLLHPIICGLIYDEASGWPDDGIPAGTPWAAVPDDWLCPDCGVSKADFAMQEL